MLARRNPSSLGTAGVAKHIFSAAERFAETINTQATDEANWDDVREAGGSSTI